MTVINGIDLTSLDIESEDLEIPEPVPGRIISIDADGLAYHCAGNDETTLAECAFNVEAEIKGRMELCGATGYVLHLTGSMDKGKRHDVATIRQYQENRNGKPKPKNLSWVRSHLQDKYGAILHTDQEADDGLAQLNYEYINRGERELCVLDSADKDLRMVPGLHLCPETGKVLDVEGYGGPCVYDADKSKLIGWGTSFFWHQMLTGDPVDAVPGLPAFSRELSIKHWPTAPLLEQRRRLAEGTMPSGKSCTAKQLDAAAAKVADIEATFKCKPCGASAVVDYLKGIDNDRDAMLAVESAYEAFYGDSYEYTDWRGNVLVRSWEQMMYEQAVLLWMRLRKGAADFKIFFDEVKNGD